MDNMNAALVTRTLKLKVQPNCYDWLNAAAVEVNQVWNFCNETFRKAARPFVDDYGTLVFPRRLTGFDLTNKTAGTTRFMAHIGADSIQRVCVEYGVKINAAFPAQRLNWRASRGSRRSLGWVPFKAASIKRNGAGVRFCGKSIRVRERKRLDGVKFRDGCFAQDAVGDWWLCVPVSVAVEQAAALRDAVGIDLGIKTIATSSDGEKLDAGRWTARFADKLAMAQRRGHKRQAKRIHRKAARCRADALHKFSSRLVRQYQRIYVGDVSSVKLVKTKMAKSVLDSGWATLRNQLQYKGQQAGRQVVIVNEGYTTRACSGCGALTGPAGLDMLVVREWTCSECGDTHDRDVNAARNILTRGKALPSVRGNEPSPSRVPSSRLRKRRRETGTETVTVAA
jgi:IS605 OrfB family transposase